MRLTHNNQEFVINFFYSKPKSGKSEENARIETSCAILSGQTNVRDENKDLIAEASVRRNHKDRENFVTARRFALAKALELSNLDNNTKEMIWEELPIRKDTFLPFDQYVLQPSGAK